MKKIYKSLFNHTYRARQTHSKLIFAFANFLFTYEEIASIAETMVSV